jgi:hypothetical protein
MSLILRMVMENPLTMPLLLRLKVVPLLIMHLQSKSRGPLESLGERDAVGL